LLKHCEAGSGLAFLYSRKDGVFHMSDPKTSSPLERLVSILGRAQFNNGSLDLTLQGPESECAGSPLKAIVYLRGEDVKSLSAELSGVATALHDIANAIRENKK
jgi:hypothetical protein